MCEALVAARTDFEDDGLTGSAWRWARGHVVDVRPDGFAWGALEDPRNFPSAATRRFALLRFPGVSVARVQKYLVRQVDPFVPAQSLRGRLWQIQWASLPLAARTILIATGVLTIGPSGDFTWAQVQNFVMNLQTGLGDSADLSG
jgi:hypothetical protein